METRNTIEQCKQAARIAVEDAARLNRLGRIEEAAKRITEAKDWLKTADDVLAGMILRPKACVEAYAREQKPGAIGFLTAKANGGIR